MLSFLWRFLVFTWERGDFSPLVALLLYPSSLICQFTSHGSQELFKEYEEQHDGLIRRQSHNAPLIQARPSAVTSTVTSQSS